MPAYVTADDAGEVIGIYYEKPKHARHVFTVWGLKSLMCEVGDSIVREGSFWRWRQNGLEST